MTIGVAEVAVVLSNKPSLGGETGEELMAQPGLALAGRADKKNVAAVARCGGDLVNEGGDRSRAGDGDAVVDRIGAGDGTEVGTELGSPQEFSSRGGRGALTRGASAADECLSDVDGRAVAVWVHAGADLGLDAVD